MSQWTSTDQAAGSPKWGAASIWQGSGRSAQAANNTPLYVNTTVGAWTLHGTPVNQVQGQFGANKFEVAQGWGKHLVTLTVTGSTTGFSNTDLINVTPVAAGQGTRKATATISTNSIGGFVNSGITITSIGLFANAETNATVVISVANSIGGVSGGSGQTSAQTIAGTTGEATRRMSTGWQMRRAGMGPVSTLSAVNGTGFANGESVKLSGGNANGLANLTTNATGNLVSA
ncbi:MAG TPA: hypothetical protein VEP90_25895, partial [Methylomirabilota bacterium]|nr:hypothetical protein [Methylomirabilota bacterium]